FSTPPPGPPLATSETRTPSNGPLGAEPGSVEGVWGASPAASWLTWPLSGAGAAWAPATGTSAVDRTTGSAASIAAPRRQRDRGAPPGSGSADVFSDMKEVPPVCPGHGGAPGNAHQGLIFLFRCRWR